ncbi:MAG: M42 family metallopeptidase [Syntrophales bacterium]
MPRSIAELVQELCELPGPPGQEQAVREFIAREVKPFCRQVREDPLGNLIAEAGAEDGYRVGVLAHMDEVGFIVSRISDRGLIGFELLGNIDARSLLNCEVDLISRQGTLIRGVVGNLSRHLQTEEEPQERISPRNLWIDIGVGSFAEVQEQGISIGSGIVFATRFHCRPNGAIMAKALDNRAGCAVLIEAIKALGPRLQGTTLYGMFTCQEEIGAKGAQVVAFDSRPQMTITLDTVPTKNPDQTGPRDTDIDRGPVIRLLDWLPSAKLGMATHPAIKERLLAAAEEIGIPFQVDVLTSTYLDSARAHLTAGGIPGGSLCIPRRYSHSAVEVGHLNDITHTLRLLIKVVEELDRKPLGFGRVYS